MKQLKYAFLPLILIVCIVALPFIRGTQSPAHAAPASTCGGWTAIPAPSPTSYTNSLNGVAPVSENDVWAVGSALADQLGDTVANIEHWDGTQWKTVTTPNPGSVFNVLVAVAAISANNVWAVGDYTDSTYTTYPLVEHWNGTKWSTVSVPPAPGLGGGFNSISVISANDIWAAGGYLDSGATNQTFVEHWDGTNWSIVQALDPSLGGNNFGGIAAISDSDVWAVGSDVVNGNYQTMIQHWDGSHWNVVTSPGTGAYFSLLTGIAAVSTNNIWSVGYANDTTGSNKIVHGLIQHWNGTKWSLVPGAKISRNSNLYGIVALSKNSIWAVGGYNPSSSVRYTLTEQWNGKQWNMVAGANPSTSQNLLVDVAPVPGTNHLWSVGETAQAGSQIAQNETRTIAGHPVWMGKSALTQQDQPDRGAYIHNPLTEYYC